MKLIIIFILLFPSILFAQASPSGRTKQNFNRGWRFHLGDEKDAQAVNFKDAGWQPVGLPHSFSIPYFMSPDFYVGYGWYRKKFAIPPDYKSKKIYLQFEGVFQVAEVYVNGQKMGVHRGGYTGFSMDITSALKAGENTVAVRVNNIWDPTLAPRAGEHTFSGGIYRDVYLVTTNSVHVDWCGTFVTTPVVNQQEAVVSVKTDIVNDDHSTKKVKLITTIVDPKGRKVQSFSSSKRIPGNALVTFDQLSKTIANPLLWDIEHPDVYTAVSTVFVDDKMVDKYETAFGIRSIRWTADSGFFLNGKQVYLQGANVHQDHAGWGDAVTNLGFYRDVKMMKDAGFNFIRGSHYPHDPAFVRACDKLGMLYWSELPFWGIGGSDNTPDGYWNTSAYPTDPNDAAPFEASLEQQLKEEIRIYRNDPSIIVWSMSNEPFFTAARTIPAMRNLLKKLVAVSHREDPTRPAAIGGAQRPLDSNRIDVIGDVAGYNGDGSIIPAFQNPGFPSMVSEYGSTPSDRPGKYAPGWGDLSKDSGRHVYQWRAGQAIWCGFDHGSIAGASLGKMGIVDYFRIPKRAWYWYRNYYRHIPPPHWPQQGVPAKISLTADRNVSGTDGTEDVKLTVQVLDKNGAPVSNDPPAKLTVVSGPGEFPTGKSIRFEKDGDIRIMDGQAAIEYRSYYAGKTIIRASSPGLQSSEIAISFTGDVPFVPGVSQEITDQPYHKYINPLLHEKLQLFGKNNPTSVSSDIQGHSGGMAADGNTNTWWQPKPSDLSPNFTLFTEKKLLLSKIKIIFPIAGVYHFKVGVSDNGNSWKTISDCSNNKEAIASKEIDLPPITGSYVRVQFDNQKTAKISEIEILGKVID